MKRRRLFWLVGALAALGALFAWARADRCGEWPTRAAALTQVTQSQGAVRAGVGKVELPLVFPTTAGGYPPLRSTVSRADTPLLARALTVEVGGQRLSLVVLDVLLIPPQLRDAIAEKHGTVWVAATHTHSGPSGFDPRAASELAALGSYSPAAFERLVEAGRKALELAEASLTEVRLEVGTAQSNTLAVPRSGSLADTRITRARFDGPQGPLAQVVIVSGHPTLAPRRPDALHGDFPSLLAAKLEANGGPLTLVLQGAGGNASVDRAKAATPEAAATALEPLVRAVLTREQPAPVAAALNEARVGLSRPDGSRLGFPVTQPIVENLLCDHAEDIALLHGLKLGELKLLFVPVEPSLEAGLVLEEQAGVERVVSLTDGYAGYVEPEAVARFGGGESHRQYFPPAFLTQLAEGARLVNQALTPVK